MNINREMVKGRNWDIFCSVVDNYGDIGVAWRLARQLAAEHSLNVRLWVDDLVSFHHLYSAINPDLPEQSVEGVNVRRWETAFPETAPADVVIEAFGCELPQTYLAAMAATQPAPVWVNLEYLSAEDWVAGCHGLPSPHPRLPLTQYFYFPGFTAHTGSLLREAGLIERRKKFQHDLAAQAEFWTWLGVKPVPDALRVSLFGYENAAVPALLKAWSSGGQPVQCLVPESKLLPQIAEFFGAISLIPGDQPQHGNLTLHVLPFFPQARYDELLWACDVNFVRGEDSLVRALWAACPLVWQIYPQQDDAHREKLDAFLARYCVGLSPPAAQALQEFWQAWNTGQGAGQAWEPYRQHLVEMDEHACQWVECQLKNKDLAANLVQFCQSKIK
ncbi:MAG: elongation factor P maturation arginine rhamnosyltransferase EarP [Sulfuriferula sp.]